MASSVEMRYLDKKYADSSTAAGSLEVAGGARADSVGYTVAIHNGERTAEKSSGRLFFAGDIS